VSALGGKIESKFLLKVHKPFSVTSAKYYVPVDNALKALPKKRRHQMTRNLRINISQAKMLKYQAIWYAGSIAVYIWFLYWMCCDFFVLHKPIAEVNPVNYAGSIASIAFIWAGTKILKPNQGKVGHQQQKSMPQKPPQQKPPQTAPQQTSHTSPANPACTHYLGYLHQRQKQQEIPEECLTCEKVIQCFSSASS
jgi:hypothetical protein